MTYIRGFTVFTNMTLMTWSIYQLACIILALTSLWLEFYNINPIYPANLMMHGEPLLKLVQVLGCCLIHVAFNYYLNQLINIYLWGFFFVVVLFLFFLGGGMFVCFGGDFFFIWCTWCIKNAEYFGDCYRKVSNIRCTKSQNLNDSRLVLQLALPNPLKPGVKSRMKM